MAGKIILSKEQVYFLIKENIYLPKNKFLSRCVDGRYKNSPDLPALAMAGGDAGQLAVIYAASNQFGFSVDEEKTLYTLLDVIGGKDLFSFHSDNHSSKDLLAGGCGHMKLILNNLDDYQITEDQINTIMKVQLPCVIGYGSQQTVVEGDHMEGAALQVEGKYGILPQYTLEEDMTNHKTQVFVYQKTFVDERHKVLAKKLIESKAVTLYDDLDEFYLAQVLSETAESHLFETVKRLAVGLPLYNVTIKDELDFQVEDLGIIQAGQ